MMSKFDDFVGDNSEEARNIEKVLAPFKIDLGILAITYRMLNNFLDSKDINDPKMVTRVINTTIQAIDRVGGEFNILLKMIEAADKLYIEEEKGKVNENAM